MRQAIQLANTLTQVAARACSIFWMPSTAVAQRSRSPSIILIVAGALTFFWLFFMLDDYGWERKKCRGLDTQARPHMFGKRSEQAEYAWYSRGRYLAIILLTYLNSVGVIDSDLQDNYGFASPV